MRAFPEPVDCMDAKCVALTFAKAEEAIRSAGGVGTFGLRPPHGGYNADTLGLKTPISLWNVDTEDWKNRNTDETTRRAVSAAREGFTFVTVEQLIPTMAPGKVYSRA